MNNQVGEKFLPIGTVVLLKNGRKKVMITGYCISPQAKIFNPDGTEQEKKEGQVFDYNACGYPEGVLNTDVTIVFNHDAIDKVVFLGYADEEQKKFSDFCNEKLKEYNKKYSETQAQ